MQWSEKYRPDKLDNYIWSDAEFEKTIRKWVEKPLSHPNLIFHGPTGTGKTTLAKIIINEMSDCADSRFISASVESGIGMIRDVVEPFCRSGGFKDYRIIVLDESDRLSRDAQQALRNVLDTYKNARFIFTCNNLSAMIDPLVGRMWSFEIAPTNSHAITEFVRSVWGRETDKKFPEDLIIGYANRYSPNIRRILNMAQLVAETGENGHAGGDALDTNGVWELIYKPASEMLSVLVKMSLQDQLAILDSITPFHVHFRNYGDELIHVLAEGAYRSSNTPVPHLTIASCLIKVRELYEKANGRMR